MYLLEQKHTNMVDQKLLKMQHKIDHMKNIVLQYELQQQIMFDSANYSQSLYSYTNKKLSNL